MSNVIPTGKNGTYDSGMKEPPKVIRRNIGVMPTLVARDLVGQ